MAQNRKPPAYQEYAANTLADRNFRLMTLAERGLFFSMRLECWQNGNVPANATDLAKYLGYENGEIEYALTARVKAFFQQEGLNLICPEIEDYRQHLNEQRRKQSEGGKRSAQKLNSKHQGQSSHSSGNLQVPCQASHESLVQYSSVQFSQAQSLDGNPIESENDDWLSEYIVNSNGS